MEAWQEFTELSYSNELLIGVGALLILWSVWRIVRSSMTLVFWVLLAGIGATSLSYGMNRSPLDLPFLNGGSVEDYLLTGKHISNEALEVMCAKFEEMSGVVE